ncbi:MAG: 3-phosphoshikimate 1-carboxyvinyltransferase [Myxococcales bacterium]|nr:3-phosphoshikimate 1-carboxyvinyltransferase [Myxococcales bacterium]
MPLPERLEIPRFDGLSARVVVPGSKSISNRAVVLAALAGGDSELRGVLDSDDLRVMERALRQLGADIEVDGSNWRVRGTSGHLQAVRDTVDVRASGTAARFLTALSTLSPGPVVIDGVARMRERPIVDLVDALAGLGADIRIDGRAGCPPLTIAGGGLTGGEATIDASRSSQYVSAVLMVAPFARSDVHLRLRDGVLVSRPYVDVTLSAMEAFGVEATFAAPGLLTVAAGQRYRGRRYTVEPDASTAAYFFAAAAITGGRILVEGLSPVSQQADIGVLSLLERMGCEVEALPEGVSVVGPSGRLRPIDVDMNAMPDAVLAMAVVALFASGPSRLRNVANLRIKETDRLAALASELTKLGARAEADADSLTIAPGPLRGCEIETYDDHRMAMALALAGLALDGVVIRDPGCVSKSWPAYFDALLALAS